MKIEVYSHINYKHSVLEHSRRYVESMFVPEMFKQQILNDDFVNNNPSFYIDYPYLFLKEDKTHFFESIDLLCFAGALYYQSLILLDRILDKDLDFKKGLPLFMVMQEEVVKDLYVLLGNSSLFWKSFQARKMELFSTYSLENSFSPSTMEDYMNFADGKSSMAKIALDALYALNLLSINEYKDCLLIHKLYYTAFQILDDISDMREDAAKHQFNLANWYLSHGISGNNGLRDFSVFFTDGIYTKLYKYVFDLLADAQVLAKRNHLDYLVSEIIRLKNTAVIQKRNIETYLYEISLELSSTYFSNDNLEFALGNAYGYLKKEQRQTGEWIDCCNNAGYSNIWCTSFVVMCLNEQMANSDILLKAKQYLNGISVDSIGYSDIWIADNDSLIMYCVAMQNYSMVSKLFDAQNIDGGIPTYSNKQELICSLSNSYVHRNVNAWLQSHPCVSSAALYLCTKAHYFTDKTLKLINYFKRLIALKNSLVYWWIDDIYTIYFLAKANEVLADDSIGAYIHKKVYEKFYANEKYENNVFYLAMLLELCCRCGYSEEAKKVKDAILQLQLSDGSWNASNFLCIPASDDEKPSNMGSWRVDNRGVNIRVNEFHRLFTTSLSISSLAYYKQKYGTK